MPADGEGEEAKGPKAYVRIVHGEVSERVVKNAPPNSWGSQVNIYSHIRECNNSRKIYSHSFKYQLY